MPPSDTWRPFQLMELPLSSADEKHSATCFACSRIWTASALAIHEATHAAVALDLGLGVEFVAIDDGQEVEVAAHEVTVYPLIRLGMKIPAICTRLDSQSLQREAKKVLVAMTAPSCVKTGHPQIDEYSAVVACMATERARRRGFEPDEILDWAKQEMEIRRVKDHVLTLAGELAALGWVDLKDVTATTREP